MNHESLIIFVRAPRPGSVKTRLAQTIGSEAACAAYRRLAERLFARVSNLTEVELRFSPDDAGAEIRPWLRDSWQMRPQGPGDLGTRLQTAFADAFARGAQRAVIIGSDCPAVSAGDIEAAWSALRTDDAVIGPASDGGYWLIGLRRCQPKLFASMNWSTNQVLAETLRRAQSIGLSVQLLRELADVDTEAEWRDFLAAEEP